MKIFEETLKFKSLYVIKGSKDFIEVYYLAKRQDRGPASGKKPLEVVVERRGWAVEWDRTQSLERQLLEVKYLQASGVSS